MFHSPYCEYNLQVFLSPSVILDQCFLRKFSDNEPPRSSCTSDVVQQTFETEVDVDWNDSNFIDNSGTVVVSMPARLPGSSFSIDDGIVPLAYTGIDLSGNDVTCDFTVTLTSKYIIYNRQYIFCLLLLTPLESFYSFTYYKSWTFAVKYHMLPC